MGADFWTNYDLDGQIYKFVVSDGPIGLRQPLDRMTTEQHDCSKSVAYPSFQMLSQTWDTELAYEMGKSLGNDCIEQKVDILLAPGVNIKRLPGNTTSAANMSTKRWRKIVGRSSRACSKFRWAKV